MTEDRFNDLEPPTVPMPNTDCLIAKVDGPGQVNLPRILRKFWPPHLCIFLHIFHIFLNLKLIVDKRGAPKAPPAYQLSILDSKKNEKCTKIC